MQQQDAPDLFSIAQGQADGGAVGFRGLCVLFIGHGAFAAAHLIDQPAGGRLDIGKIQSRAPARELAKRAGGRIDQTEGGVPEQTAFNGDLRDFKIQAVGGTRTGSRTADAACHGQHAIDGLQMKSRVVHVR